LLITTDLRKINIEGKETNLRKETRF